MMSTGQDLGDVLDAMRELLSAPDKRRLPGKFASLWQRLERHFPGDSIRQFTGASTGPTNAQTLPDHPYAMAAHLYVVTGPIIWRDDAAAPVLGVDELVMQGSYIDISGIASIKQFQWASGFAGSSVIVGHYFA
jgi:hypothetical protein